MSIATAWFTITRIQEILEEFEKLIGKAYPEATFDIEFGGEPDGVYLIVTVDLEDTEEVLDVVMDRMLEVQIEERLPVYVLPLRPTGSKYEPGRRQEQTVADIAATA
jgi:hypothetical protein